MHKHIRFVISATILTILFGTMYGAMQQTIRSESNEPQVQMAHDVAAQISDGTPPASIIKSPVDMATSLAPFVIIYDKAGNPVGGYGKLNGTLADIPIGVLKHSENVYDHRISWQPADDVRIASVTVATKNYYVTAGRSMRESEKRVTLVGSIVLLGWLMCISILIIMTTSWEYLTGELHFNGARKSPSKHRS